MTPTTSYRMRQQLLRGILLALCVGNTCCSNSNEKTGDTTASDTAYSLADALKAPGKILVLDLSGKNINELPAETEQLTNLGELNISSNRLTHFPALLYNLHHLQRLNIEGNFIPKNEIDSFARSHPSVAMLFSDYPPTCTSVIDCLADSASPDLKVILNKQDYSAATLEKLSTLKCRISLDLSLVDTATVYPELGHISTLYELSLFNNGISDLPHELGSLKSLEKLDAGKNKLRRIDDCIFEMASLSHLDLHDNSIREVGAGIGRLEHLEYLDLSGNVLTALPKEIASCKKLKTLHLENNAIPEQEKKNIRALLPDTEVFF